MSPDLDRVLALPRRAPLDPSSPRAEALVQVMTERLRRPDRPPGSPCGCAALGRRRCLDRLLPVQAQALWELGLRGGLLGPIGVGQGKTCLDVLAPVVVRDCRLAVLLVPPGLVEQLVREYLAWGEHFAVPDLLLADGREFRQGPPRQRTRVVAYSTFSLAGSTDLLERLAPDLVVADEAHCLRRREAARTGRALRYLAEHHPDVRFACWSGTLVARSLRDFAHLSAFALGKGSPLPVDPDEVEVWAQATDPSPWPRQAGALRRLCAPGEPLREAVRRRLVETPGVVAASSPGGAQASVALRERRPLPVPDAVWKALLPVRATWTRPDGEELVDALSVARCAGELACGFYYRWVFPGDPDPRLVWEWFKARRDWHRELREVLGAAAPHMDSPMLCAKAAVRAYQLPRYSGDLPTWRAASWPRWRELRHSVRHETEVVWIDKWLAEDAAEWARSERGVVWYSHDAFGRAVAEAAGLPLHCGGPGDDGSLAAERGDRSVVASLRSHGSGRDGLQRLFSTCLVANPPGSGDAWEQLVGRLHREGQEADEVAVHVYRHTEELRAAVDRAIEEAKYVREVTGSPQKLLLADVEWARLQSLARSSHSGHAPTRGRENATGLNCREVNGENECH